MPLPGKLISGGQFGADLGGWRAGLILGIPTGGWMPRGFLTERGPRQWFRVQYGAQEHASPLYGPRTDANVASADISLLFGDWRSPGGKRLRKAIGDRPLLVNPGVRALQELAEACTAETVINVAGNRESGNPKIEEYVCAVIVDAWADLVPLPPLDVLMCTGTIDAQIEQVMRADKLRKLAPYPPNGPQLPEFVRR